MTEHSILLDLKRANSTIQIDGADIAHVVTGLRLLARPDLVPELQLTIKLPRLNLEALGTVALADDVREFLMSLGWTPPADSVDQSGQRRI